MDFKANTPFEEGVISETKQRPDKTFFQKPQELESLINTGRLVQKCLLKQVDIDKILKVIQKKVLKGTHVPVTVKEIQAGYLVNPQNKLPNTKTAIQKVATLAERYILLDSLLFKIVTTPEKEMALLAIPEVCADRIITLYHSGLFAGHQGVIKHISQ